MCLILLFFLLFFLLYKHVRRRIPPLLRIPPKHPETIWPLIIPQAPSYQHHHNTHRPHSTQRPHNTLNMVITQTKLHLLHKMRLKPSQRDVCREWLFIIYTLFGMLVLQSKAGEKIMQNPISSAGMTLVYIGMDIVYIYRVYKVLLVGPKLPRFEMRFILYCCCFFTAVNMNIITYQFLPWGIVVREEYRGIVAVFFTPIWSVLWGCLWIVPVLAQCLCLLCLYEKERIMEWGGHRRRSFFFEDSHFDDLSF